MTKEEHDNVVRYICAQNESRFTVRNNLESDTHYVGNLFPDILLFRKKDETEELVFIIEVRRNGEIAQCIQQWKLVKDIPATLYIIVPEQELSNAKAIADVVGLKTKFGAYKTVDGKVQVVYE